MKLVTYQGRRVRRTRVITGKHSPSASEGTLTTDTEISTKDQARPPLFSSASKIRRGLEIADNTEVQTVAETNLRPPYVHLERNQSNIVFVAN